MRAELKAGSPLSTRAMSEILSIESLMSGLFLGPDAPECVRVVRKVEELARESRGLGDMGEDGYYSEVDLEPVDRWHSCMDTVRRDWHLWKEECPQLHPWHRRAGHETDNRLHLEDVLHRLGDAWRARDYLISHMIDRDEESEREIRFQDCDLRPMALFMLAVVRAEELEAEALRVTRAVRARYGDAGLPVGLEGLIGGERSLQWWLRETSEVEVDE